MGWFGFCMISSFFGGDGDGGGRKNHRLRQGIKGVRIMK